MLTKSVGVGVAGSWGYEDSHSVQRSFAETFREQRKAKRPRDEADFQKFVARIPRGKDWKLSETQMSESLSRI